MRTSPLLLGCFILCSAASEAGAESMQDFWRERQPMAVLTSGRTAAALEMCLGMEGAETGAPIVLRGERETLITIMQPGQIISTLMGFRIIDQGAARKIEVWARGSTLGTWSKRASDAASRCIA